MSARVYRRKRRTRKCSFSELMSVADFSYAVVISVKEYFGRCRWVMVTSIAIKGTSVERELVIL